MTLSSVPPDGTDEAERQTTQRGDLLVTKPAPEPPAAKPSPWTTVGNRTMGPHGLWYELKDPWDLTQRDIDNMTLGSLPAVTALQGANWKALKTFEDAGNRINPNNLESAAGLLKDVGELDLDAIMGVVTAMQDSLCVGWLAGWGKKNSRAEGEPVPTVAEIRDVMPGPLYQHLSAAVSKLKDVDPLSPDFGLTEGMRNPKVPGGASSPSKPHGRATRSPKSRPR